MISLNYTICKINFYQSILNFIIIISIINKHILQKNNIFFNYTIFKINKFTKSINRNYFQFSFNASCGFIFARKTHFLKSNHVNNEIIFKVILEILPPHSKRKLCAAQWFPLRKHWMPMHTTLHSLVRISLVLRSGNHCAKQ